MCRYLLSPDSAACEARAPVQPANIYTCVRVAERGWVQHICNKCNLNINRINACVQHGSICCVYSYWHNVLYTCAFKTEYSAVTRSQTRRDLLELTKVTHVNTRFPDNSAFHAHFCRPWGFLDNYYGASICKPPGTAIWRGPIWTVLIDQMFERFFSASGLINTFKIFAEFNHFLDNVHMLLTPRRKPWCC